MCYHQASAPLDESELQRQTLGIHSSVPMSQEAEIIQAESGGPESRADQGENGEDQIQPPVEPVEHVTRTKKSLLLPQLRIRSSRTVFIEV
jgi:hypothetical protein